MFNLDSNTIVFYIEKVMHTVFPIEAYMIKCLTLAFVCIHSFTCFVSECPSRCKSLFLNVYKIAM